MKRLRYLIVLACAAPLFSAYTYYWTESWGSTISGNWTQNGTISASGGLTSASANGGSLISTLAVPDGTSYYEVRTTLALTQSGGSYITYLHATTNALSGPATAGTFYAIELQNPTFNGSSCTATLAAYKVISAAVTLLSSSVVPCHNGMVIRAVYGSYNYLPVYIDNIQYALIADLGIPSGQPGVGVRGAPAGNGIQEADLGRHDGIAPAPVNTQLITTGVFSNRVDMQWNSAADDVDGVGIGWYQIVRNGSWIANLRGTSTFTDSTVAANTAYTYVIYAWDYHMNYSTASFNVTTLPPNEIEARQTGVRPTGSYWGGGGENIDMRSGNLNYTIPLVKAMGRGGWGVAFNLTYNSQNWRYDPNGYWQLGRDLGYGYGWKLLAGSLTPFYSNYWTLDHYLFTDGTGAEYRLDVANGDGTWQSKEGVYLYYDPGSLRLYFRDGTFWVMGSASSGTEQDSGTVYPSTMQDTNGNQILLHYNTGQGVSWPESSSRIASIEDVRGKGFVDYSFTYNTDAIPHLTSITNTIGTAEKYTFGLSSSPLYYPDLSTQYGTSNWSFLTSVTQTGPNLTTTLASYSDGDLGQVTTPYGGHLRWDYVWIPLSGSRYYREVQNRYLLANIGAAENQYTLQRLGSDSGQSIHTYADWFDWSGNAEKVWWFQTGTTATNAGLPTAYEERSYNPRVALSHNDYTWTTDGVGNPYIGSTLSTLGSVQKKSVQTLDNYGNATQTQLFDWGNLSTPARTYNNTYLINQIYSPKYILNRLLSSTVTPAGGSPVTLVTNQYDTSPTDVVGMQEHDPAYTTGYTIRGNLATSTSLGTVSSYAYDIGGNILSKSVNGLTVSVTTSSNTNFAAPGTITTNSTLTTTINYNSALALSSQTGPNGETAAIGYDTNLRPTSTTSPYGAITYFTYNDAASPPTKTATTGNRAVITSMDGFGRPIKLQTLDAGVVKSIVDTQYAPCACSPMGKLSRQSLPYVTGGPLWTVYTYDALGRTLSSAAPDGSTTRYAYLNNTVTVTDPANHAKTFAMDAFGNLSNVTESDPALGAVYTYYAYDVLNHLTAVSMPRGSATQTRSFSYGNPPGANLLSATNPETGTVNYSYNGDGTLHSKTDANGQTLVYNYDAYKRLVTVTNSGVTLRTYSYDTNPYDGSYSQNAWGRLTAVQYSRANGDTFTDMLSYWAPGAVKGKRLRVARTLWTGARPSADVDAAYVYDSEGRVSSVTYPTTYNNGDGNNPSQVYPAPIAGSTFAYTFDGLGRATAMTQNSAGLVSNVQYGAASELLQMTYSGITETRGYNSLFQLTQIAAGGINIQYAYPAAGANNGKIASQTDAFTAETVTYAYDTLNRLISANSTFAGQSQAFGYDGFGNLTSKPPLSVNVDPATNRITSLTYDGNGNVIFQPGMTGNYNYDVENRMTSAPGVQYGYDGQNKRNYKAAVNSGGTVTSDEFYFYGADGKRIGTYYLQAIAVGSPTNLTLTFTSTSPFTSATSTPLVYFRGRVLAPQDRLGSFGKYYPYGEDKGGGNPANDNLKFATYTRDAATLLDYADQRYYASQFGRFMSADPYMASGGPGDPGSWNRYAYTRGDPVNRFDPSGLNDCTFGSDICVDVWGVPQIGFNFDFGNVIQQALNALNAQIAAGLAQLSMSLSDRLSASEERVRKDLSKSECTKDFKDLNAVLNKIGQIKFKEQGLPQYRTVNGEVQSIDSGPGLGAYNPFTRSITLNSSINWALPGLQNAFLDGHSFITNLMAGEANALGVPDVNPGQLMDITILHELSHYKGVIGNPDKDPSVEQKLWRDCIQ